MANLRDGFPGELESGRDLQTAHSQGQRQGRGQFKGKECPRENLHGLLTGTVLGGHSSLRFPRWGQGAAELAGPRVSECGCPSQVLPLR